MEVNEEYMEANEEYAFIFFVWFTFLTKQAC